jgi:hypothetical protein
MTARDRPRWVSYSVAACRCSGNCGEVFARRHASHYGVLAQHCSHPLSQNI